MCCIDLRGSCVSWMYGIPHRAQSVKCRSGTAHWSCLIFGFKILVPNGVGICRIKNRRTPICKVSVSFFSGYRCARANNQWIHQNNPQFWLKCCNPLLFRRFHSGWWCFDSSRVRWLIFVERYFFCSLNCLSRIRITSWFYYPNWYNKNIPIWDKAV